MNQEARKNRKKVLAKIALYEKNGWFDRDVEEDPPTVPLRPGTVDYTGRRLSTRLQTWLANRVADAFFARELRKKRFFIKEVRGIEHFKAVTGGAILTCNHFNAYDNYAVWRAIRGEMRGRSLYKVIREGNYTSFGGLYGYFFRHCNTLPLASNLSVLKEFNAAVDTLLSRGEKILIYPEQGMWWNYKKPRPLKVGGFHLAAKSGVPVIPCFITMEDTDELDEGGFPVQAYTVHILPPLFPDAAKSVRENTALLREQNQLLWKEKYEEVYGIPLRYDNGT